MVRCTKGDARYKRYNLLPLVRWGAFGGYAICFPWFAGTCGMVESVCFDGICGMAGCVVSCRCVAGRMQSDGETITLLSPLGVQVVGIEFFRVISVFGIAPSSSAVTLGFEALGAGRI